MTCNDIEDLDKWGEALGTNRTLTADYNVMCSFDDDEYFNGFVTAWIFMVLYVAGVPLFIFFLLWSNRSHLHNSASPNHMMVYNQYGSLYSQYEKPYWWYEIMVLVKKSERCCTVCCCCCCCCC